MQDLEIILSTFMIIFMSVNIQFSLKNLYQEVQNGIVSRTSFQTFCEFCLDQETFSTVTNLHPNPLESLFPGTTKIVSALGKSVFIQCVLVINHHFTHFVNKSTIQNIDLRSIFIIYLIKTLYRRCNQL